MRIFKKVLTCAALVMAFGSTAQASMINVGGVTWDPDAVAGGDSDFTAKFEFSQFFTSGANQIQNVDNAAPNAANAINPATVGFGDVLQGFGEIFKLNGVSYNTSTLLGGGFCPSCELTFTFGGFVINGPTTFTNGWLKIYVDDTPDLNVSSPTTGAEAADGNLFLELTGIANQFASFGGFASGSFANYFAVTGGLAASNFDTNTQAFASDLLQSASASFFDSLVATATGQIKGNSIPEPSSIFLLSLALLALAFVRRHPANK